MPGGYVTDVAYVRSFIPELAPAWLDHVALISGVEPPRRGEFSWCDLGCGFGITALILAALHPHGHFVGIDVMPAHIDGARRLAQEASIRNVSFFSASFEKAHDLDFSKFDYIVAHGVYTWVDHETQENLHRFIQQHLKPGGLVYLGYNALPGRGPDVAFQYLLRSIALTCPGDSIDRVSAAMSIVQDLARLNPAGLARSFAHIDLAQNREQLEPAYIAHEFMAEHWQPLFVTEVRRRMANIGLTPVGSASLVQNYDSYILRKAERDALEGITDRHLRELMRDFFIDQKFRRDVFSSAPRFLTAAEQQELLFNTTLCLSRPQSGVQYSLSTPAGKLSFENQFAKKIVAELTRGPRKLREIVADSADRGQFLANALVLCAARMLRAVEGGNADVRQLNDTVFRRLGSSEEMRHLAFPCGTAFRLDRASLQALRDQTDSGRTFPDLRAFLVSHGVVNL